MVVRPKGKGRVKLLYTSSFGYPDVEASCPKRYQLPLERLANQQRLKGPQSSGCGSWYLFGQLASTSGYPRLVKFPFYDCSVLTEKYLEDLLRRMPQTTCSPYSPPSSLHIAIPWLLN